MKRYCWFGSCLFAVALLACSSSDSEVQPSVGGSGGVGGHDASAGSGGSAAGGTAGLGGAGHAGSGGTAGSAGAAGSGGVAGSGGLAGSAGTASGGTAGSAAGGTAGTSGSSGGAGGPGCLDGDECGPTMVCSLQTQTCVDSECNDTGYDCPEVDDVCLPQIPSAHYGACYAGCTPFEDTVKCASGFECYIALIDFSSGYCMRSGTKATKAPCEKHDTSTDCVPGAICANLGTQTTPQYECVEQCNFFGASSTCKLSDQHCSWGGWCVTPPAENVALGQPCAASAEGADCALDNGIARGTCAKVGGNIVCSKWCRMNTSPSDCPSGQSCKDDYSYYVLGICR